MKPGDVVKCTKHDLLMTVESVIGDVISCVYFGDSRNPETKSTLYREDYPESDLTITEPPVFDDKEDLRLQSFALIETTRVKVISILSKNHIVKSDVQRAILMLEKWLINYCPENENDYPYDLQSSAKPDKS